MRCLLFILSAVLLSGCAHQETPQTHVSYKDMTPVNVKHSKLVKTDRTRLAALKASIPSYHGPCGCPDQIKSDGSQCKGNSAASMSGGKHVLCEINSMTLEQIQDAKRKYGARLYRR